MRNKKNMKNSLSFLGMNFSLEFTSLMMDISLFAFFCTKTFLGQLTMLEYITFAAFIGFTIIHVLKFRKKNGLKLKTKMFFVWYGAFALFATLSILWALNVEFVLKMLPSVIALFVFAVAITYYTEDKNQLNKVIVLYVLANFLAAIEIVICFWFVEGTAAERVGEITGIFSNTIAQTIALSVVAMAYLAIKNRKYIWRYLTMMFMMVVAILLSGSRKAILIPVVGIAVMLIFKKKTKRELKIYFTVFGLVMVALVLVLALNDGLRAEMLDLLSSTLLGKETGDWSIQLRNFFQETAIDLWEQRPLTGAGLNNFAYYVSHFTEYTKIRYSHNNYVELLSCLGIVGLVLYYWMYSYIIITVIKKKRKNRDIDISFAFASIISLAIFEWGIVSYSGVMYSVVIFIAFCLSSHAYDGEALSLKEKVV